MITTPVRLILIGPQICKWVQIHIFRLSTSWLKMTFDLDLWPFDSMNKFGSNRISTFQMKPLSHFQPILQLDFRWPSTLMWPLTSSTNDDSYVASMTQLWLKSTEACGRYSQMLTCFHNDRQQTTTSVDKVIPMRLSCSGDTKIVNNSSDSILW